MVAQNQGVLPEGKPTSYDQDHAAVSPRLGYMEELLVPVSREQSRIVKQFKKLLGLMAAASNVLPFGLLYMRLSQWWLRTRGFSPRGNPLRTIKITWQCLRALVIWRKYWFLSQVPVLGALCHRVAISTDASLTGWGAVLGGRSSQGLWRSHHLFGT